MFDCPRQLFDVWSPPSPHFRSRAVGSCRGTFTTSDGATATYAHDPARNLIKTTLPASNGYTETRGYDAGGRTVPRGLRDR